nr:MAG TPA: hypothetical protein [Caudoviricetes sp.]
MTVSAQNEQNPITTKGLILPFYCSTLSRKCQE